MKYLWAPLLQLAVSCSTGA
ncbi:hypothetical protein Nmel_010959 [Mimus melanotis]